LVGLGGMYRVVPGVYFVALVLQSRLINE